MPGWTESKCSLERFIKHRQALSKQFSSLRIGQITIPKPIIQGGMGIGVSLSNLASAVSKAGGLGVISAVAIGLLSANVSDSYHKHNEDVLRKEIQKAKAMTDRPIGVNVMVALTDYENMVHAAAEEGVEVIICGGGLPINLPKCLPENSKTELVPIVSSPRAAKLLLRKWSERHGVYPGAVVLEGPLAGGHLGFSVDELNDPTITLQSLIPETVKAIAPFAEEAGRPIPLIAAGGIFTGADICEAFLLGAAGVQMGTRFVATDECDAADAFKQAYVNCTKEDLILIESPVGMPGRAIKNDFLAEAKSGNKVPKVCPWHCIVTCKQQKSPYCIARALLNAKNGRLNEGFAFAGANAYRVNEIVPVETLMQTLESEYTAAVASNPSIANCT